MNYKMKENTEVRVAISGKSGCGNTTDSTYSYRVARWAKHLPD